MVIGTELKKDNVAKRGKIEIDTPEACEIFMEAMMGFRRRKRYTQWVQIKHVAPLLKKGRGMWKSFTGVVEQLEILRCSVQLEPGKFYRVVSEFTVEPRGWKFYPVRQVFGEGWLQDQFLERAYSTLIWVCDICEDDEDTSWVSEFINLVKEKVKVFDTDIDYRSKDWYCMKSISRINDVKGWTEDEMLAKLRNFYSGRRKKVTAEMMLSDLTHGELDVTPIAKKSEEKKEKKEKSEEKKKVHIKAMDIDEWLKS